MTDNLPNPFAKDRGKLSPDSPKNLLAEHPGPITPEVVRLFNSAQWGVGNSGPTFLSKDGSKRIGLKEALASVAPAPSA